VYIYWGDSLLDVWRVREDFPILKRGVIYFDNAATTHKPLQVINAVKNFYEFSNSNVHRGVHKLSIEATKLYEEAHDEVRKFINARYLEEIVFTSGATHSLNMIAYMLGLKLNKDDNVVVSIMEHHSNLLPWIFLSNIRGFELRVVGLKNDYTLDYESLSNLVDSKTKVIAITHMSNVLGTIVDIKRISKIAHENNALLVVDCAQSVPHIPVSVTDLDVDFIAFSGHKMLGPTGIGVLYVRKEVQEDLKPVFVGGGTVETVKYVDGKFIIKFLNLPWSLEAGTPNIAGAVGLAEAIRYLSKLGMDNVASHEKRLVEHFINRVKEDESLSNKVVIYGPLKTEDRGGIISYNIIGSDPNVVATFLDTYNIAVRSGYHCAQPLHDYIGASSGTVRASFYIYNTIEEVDVMIEALKEFVRIIST
jgi:cysteine desulfurase/selenocysteine lyase